MDSLNAHFGPYPVSDESATGSFPESLYQSVFPFTQSPAESAHWRLYRPSGRYCFDDLDLTNRPRLPSRSSAEHSQLVSNRCMQG